MTQTKNNIVITGASGNIGSKVATFLMELDCKLIVNGRNKKSLHNLKARQNK